MDIFQTFVLHQLIYSHTSSSIIHCNMNIVVLILKNLITRTEYIYLMIIIYNIDICCSNDFKKMSLNGNFVYRISNFSYSKNRKTSLISKQRRVISKHKSFIFSLQSWSIVFETKFYSIYNEVFVCCMM